MKKLLFVSKKNEVKKVTIVDISNYLTKSLEKFLPNIKTKEFSGTSPPEVFVGRIGYPKVFVGPLVSPLENSEHLLYTENWFGKRLEEIFSLRLQAVRGKMLRRVNDAVSYTHLTLPS